MDGAQTTKTIRVILAQPRGFCAGVDRAIEIVERALRNTARRSMSATKSSTTAMWWKTSAPGARVFVEELDEVPDGA